MSVRGIFLLAIGIALHNGGFAFSDETRTADERFLIATERLGRVSVEKSLRSLKAVLASDENHVPALVEIAKLYMTSNTPLGRSSAEKMLRRAIRLDPVNADYRVLMGDLMWAQGFLWNAKRQYEEVLAQDAQNARAAFGLGLYYTKDFMKYWNMIDLGGNTHSVVLEWRHFAKEYRDRAIQFLERSIRYDPRFKDAYYQLGLVYMEDMRLDPAAAGMALVYVANALLQAYPRDKDALLFVGLGYHTSGYLDGAWGFFERALERMGVEERSIIESVNVVAVDEVRTQIEQEDSEVRKHGENWLDSPERERFWREQDPLLLTERNER